MTVQADRSLDCSGLFCPMPIINTKRELQGMQAGQVLEILADDPGFEKDLPAWCRAAGEEFIALEREGRTFKGYVRKK